MKLRWKREEGAFSIDALLGITFFMISILALMFMALIIRVQANVQYALGQTAKEISGYYYLLDKCGLAAATTGGNSSRAKDVDETIGYVIDFSDGSKEMGEDLSDFNLMDGISEDELNDLSENADNAKDLYETAGKIGNNLKTIGSNPKEQIMGVLSVFAKTMVNRGLSYYVAPMVCKAIMPRYLSGDAASTNEYLESIGIEGGIDGMDFSQSQLLTDNRSIKLVVVYKLNTEALTFGIVKTELIFRQSASTAAWIAPDGENTYKLSQLEIPTEAETTEATEASEE